MRIRFLIAQLTAAALLTWSGLAQALPRQVQILKLDVPPGLPAPPGNLALLGSSLRLQAVASGFAEGAEAVIVLQIRKAGQLSCGNTADAGVPVRISNQMQFDGKVLARAWAACSQLDPGGYALCARFYGLDGNPISEEACTEFQVAEAVSVPSYAAPVNLSPADQSFELEESFRSGIRFSWKPVEPAYEGALTYRLRVWAIPEGKDVQAVVSEGKPLLTRDLANLTETTLSNSLPLSATPGKVNRFAWTVQALDAMGQPVGTNLGTSNPSTFASTTYAIRLDKISVSCTSTPGVYSFSFSLTNPNIGAAKLTALLATSSMPAGAVVTSFAPPLNTNIPAGVQLTVTGTVSAPPGLSNICIGAQITDQGNSFWQASKDSCIPVKACKCEACDPKYVNIQTGSPTVSPGTNTLSLAQPLTVTTTPLKLVKSVSAELAYFAYTPDNEDCMPCNKDSRTFGNFLGGNLGAAAGSGNGTHSLSWAFAPAKSGSGITPFNASISLPPMVGCCAATVRFCIRYVITFADCTVCYKQVCYEKRLDGCPGGKSSTPNN